MAAKSEVSMLVVNYDRDLDPVWGRAKFTDVEPVYLPSPTLVSLCKALRAGHDDLAYPLVLISGPVSEGGLLCMKDETGREELVAPEQMAAAFRDAGVLIVVLHFYSGVDFAPALREAGVLAVVTLGKMSDPEAMLLVQELLLYLAAGNTVGGARNFAQRSLVDAYFHGYLQPFEDWDECPRDQYGWQRANNIVLCGDEDVYLPFLSPACADAESILDLNEPSNNSLSADDLKKLGNQWVLAWDAILRRLQELGSEDLQGKIKAMIGKRVQHLAEAKVATMVELGIVQNDANLWVLLGMLCAQHGQLVAAGNCIERVCKTEQKSILLTELIFDFNEPPSNFSYLSLDSSLQGQMAELENRCGLFQTKVTALGKQVEELEIQCRLCAMFQTKVTALGKQVKATCDHPLAMPPIPHREARIRHWVLAVVALAFSITQFAGWLGSTNEEERENAGSPLVLPRALSDGIPEGNRAAQLVKNVLGASANPGTTLAPLTSLNFVSVHPSADGGVSLVGSVDSLETRDRVVRIAAALVGAGRVYANELRVEAPISPSKQYTVQGGDTLWSIAEKSLGHGHRWNEIKEKNRSIVPEKMPVGLELTLP
jgi:hypothetical protein